MNEFIEISATDNHQFSAYISQPLGKPKAGIVIIQEIFGVNTHIKDVTAFLAWASEPEMEDRKRLGISVMLFLLLLTALTYFSMKQIWAPIKKQ